MVKCKNLQRRIIKLSKKGDSDTSLLIEDIQKGKQIFNILHKTNLLHYLPAHILSIYLKIMPLLDFIF